jgi:transcriptional regulator with XRE-family HTH domain
MIAFVTPQQIRGARAILNWKQERLAEASGTSIGTVNKFEQNEKISNDSRQKIRKALENARIEFVEGGVVLRTESKSKAFDGSDGPDIFYQEILTAAKEWGGDLWAVYDTAETFAKSLGIIDGNGLERIETLSRFVTVKCLLTDFKKSSLDLPMCQFRSVPRMLFGYEFRAICGDLHAQLHRESNRDEFSYYLSERKELAMEAVLDISSSWNAAIAMSAGGVWLKQARG